MPHRVHTAYMCGIYTYIRIYMYIYACISRYMRMTSVSAAKIARAVSQYPFPRLPSERNREKSQWTAVKFRDHSGVNVVLGLFEQHDRNAKRFVSRSNDKIRLLKFDFIFNGVIHIIASRFVKKCPRVYNNSR